MKQYAIFHDDSEITVTLISGDLSNMPAVREEIKAIMDSDKNIDSGYVEQYPFYKADWVITGGRFEPGFDMNQIIEI